jgi:hypothetical protein
VSLSLCRWDYRHASQNKRTKNKSKQMPCPVTFSLVKTMKEDEVSIFYSSFILSDVNYSI